MNKPINKRNVKLPSGKHNRQMRPLKGFEEQPESQKLVRTQPHHRRPRSLDGSSDISNISLVRPRPHGYWHILYGNLNAYEICESINLSPFKPEEEFLECRFINGSPVTKKGGNNHSENEQKRQIAWEYLFGKLSFSQAISYINNVWLDPSYHFYIRRRRRKK